MLKIATPISHLFKDETQAKNICSFSDCLECRDHSPECDLLEHEIFHCEIQPIHHMNEGQFEYLKSIKNEKKGLRLISFHMASCYDMPLIQNGKFLAGGKYYRREEMKQIAFENFRKIKKIFGTDVKLAIENNNYYQTAAYEIICDPLFISEIVHENEIGFLFDIAHAHVSSINMGITYEEYKGGLPLDRIYQIHICKSSTRENAEAFDAHLEPDGQEWTEIELLKKIAPNLKYLTIEFYRDSKTLANLLKDLKNQLLKYE